MNKKYKVVIVGGGTAGWFAASWIAKNHNCHVTLIESKDIKKIGVGESVTPHIQRFFDLLGMDRTDWMQKTGAIYKFANKFDNWVHKKGETEYFGFTYAANTKAFDQENYTLETLFKQDDQLRTTDVFLKLYQEGKFDKFDQYFNDAHYYMENCVSPFHNDQYLLNPFYSWSQHMNAELATDYIRDNVALPNGVEHIIAEVVDITAEGETVKSVTLTDGTKITADIFVDSTGFAGVLVNKMGFERIKYDKCLIDSAYVCQIDYENPETEMVNYTQSHAMDFGWRFKADVYHRMGTGYCFSSQHISNEQALEEFSKHIPKNRFDPKLLKWTPSRLVNAAKGNLFSIGLSSGFVEPLEASSLFIITANVMHMGNVLKKYEDQGILDLDAYNSQIGYLIDDIADFIRVHYTLSSRTDTEFWRDCQTLVNREFEIELVKNKYFSNSGRWIKGAEYKTIYTDYVWLQLAMSWGVNVSDWQVSVDPTLLEKGRNYFQSRHDRNLVLAKTCKNNYNWLKENIFKLEPAAWEAEFLLKK